MVADISFLFGALLLSLMLLFVIIYHISSGDVSLVRIGNHLSLYRQCVAWRKFLKGGGRKGGRGSENRKTALKYVKNRNPAWKFTKIPKA